MAPRARWTIKEKNATIRKIQAKYRIMSIQAKQRLKMNIKDRIVEFARIPAKELKPNPRNWRTHPKAQQDALRGVLAEVGYAGAVIARRLEDGTLELIDGHLRAETTPDQDIPVLILDVDEREANYLLATIDPLGNLAETNASILDDLLRDVQSGNAAVQEMIGDLYRKSENPTIEDVLANDEWVGLPEYENGEAAIKLIIQFRSLDDRIAFEKQAQLPSLGDTQVKSIWWPEKEKSNVTAVQFIIDESCNAEG